MNLFKKIELGVIVRVVVFTLLTFSLLQHKNTQMIINKTWSFLDVFIYMTNVYNYLITILPVTILELFFCVRNKTLPNYVIRLESRKKHFFSQLKIALNISIFYAVIYFIYVFVWTLWKHLSIFNWSEPTSHYCAETQNIYTGSGFGFCMVGLILLIIRTFVWLTIVQIVNWHTSYFYLGVVICAIFSGLENASNVFFGFQFVNHIFQADYLVWTSFLRRCFVLLSSIVFFLIVYLYGSIITGGKDYINE